MSERRNIRVGEDPVAYMQEQFGGPINEGFDPNNFTTEEAANMLDAIHYGAYGAGNEGIQNGDLSSLTDVAQNGLAPVQGPGQYNQFEGGYTDDSGQYHLGPSQWEHDSAWAETTSYDELAEAGNYGDARTWVKQQYISGNLTAEEAQALENEAFESQFGSLSYTYQPHTWGDNNTLSSRGYVSHTYTPTDYSTLSQDPANWSRGTNQHNVERVTTQDLGGSIFKAIAASALTAGAGGALVGAGMVPGSVALGATKGAIGGGISGVINGEGFDLGGIARGALTGGLMAAGSDYLRDTLDGIESDVGGLFGEGGLIGGDRISTSGANELLFGIGSPEDGLQMVFNSNGDVIGKLGNMDPALVQNGMDNMGWQVGYQMGVLNNPVTNAISGIVTPVLETDIAQSGLDWLTESMMNGYNDEWKEHYELQDITDGNGNVTGRVWDFDFANASAEDIDNYNRFMAAQQTGMWRLDEQYSFTDTPRSDDSNMVGILPIPIEAGGNPYVPTQSPSNASEGDKGDGEGDGEGSGSSGSNGLLSGGNGSSASDAIGGVDGAGGNGYLPSNNGADSFLPELILAYEAETDPVQKEYLKNQIEYYSQESLAVESGQALPSASDQSLPVPVYDSDLLLPGGVADDQLPSSGGGGAAVAGLLGGGSGDRTNEDPEWGPLFKYMKLDKWQRAREKMYRGLLS